MADNLQPGKASKHEHDLTMGYVQAQGSMQRLGACQTLAKADMKRKRIKSCSRLFLTYHSAHAAQAAGLHPLLSWQHTSYTPLSV